MFVLRLFNYVSVCCVCLLLVKTCMFLCVVCLFVLVWLNYLFMLSRVVCVLLCLNMYCRVCGMFVCVVV